MHVPFRWPAQLGAVRVSVFGSWDGWRQKVPLARSPVTGDFVRALALPLDPRGADGTAAAAAAGASSSSSSSSSSSAAAAAARQIEYKFEVEYDDGDTDDQDEAGAGSGSSSSSSSSDAGQQPAPSTRARARRVAVRPAPSDPLVRTAAPVFASPSTRADGAGGGGDSAARPPLRRHTESHANNKRLLAPNKVFVLPGTSPDDEVLAVTDYGGWHAAIPLAYNPKASRHEAVASFPPGSALSYRFLVNGRAALAPGGLLPVAPAPPPAPAGRLAHRDAALPPPRAFTLFYATGWPSATLVYRFRLPDLAAGASAVPVTPWQQLPMDVAPSRDAPDGGRWMTAVVEPPPALRRDPWSLEQRAEEAEAEEAAGGGGSSSSGSSSSSGGGGGGVANRVAALAAAPSPACELEFFVRGPPVAPPPPAPDDGGAAADETAAPHPPAAAPNGASGGDDGSNAALAAPCPRHPEEDRGPGGSSSSSSGGAAAAADAGAPPQRPPRQQRHYVLPAPMAWKLARGRVRKFPRALRPPTMLVSDLDHTLYAEGEPAAAALARFTHYWESEAALARSVLVYNTGRSLGQFVSLVNEQRGRLALPDVLVTAVGTKVFHLKAEWRGKTGHGGGGGGAGGGGSGGGGHGGGGSSPYHPSHVLVTTDDWTEDLAWARRLDRGWDLGKAREAAESAIAAARERFSRGWRDEGGDGWGGGGPSHVPGDQIVNWLDDGSEHPHRVAVSCHVRATPYIVASLRAGTKARGVRARVIVSGQGDWRYVDCVARRAGKAAALEHARRLYGVAPERTMAAGDSCNDVLMLAAAADGGMAEALAAPLARAAAAAAAAEGQDGGSGGDGAAASLLLMRDFWAGGGSRTFLDEVSDLSCSGDGAAVAAQAAAAAAAGGSGGGGDGADEQNDEDDGGGGEEEEQDGDGGRAPRVRAVIVGNAQRELVEWYHDALKEDTGAASIVLAGAPLADGVLEGLMRHGLY